MEGPAPIIGDHYSTWRLPCSHRATDGLSVAGYHTLWSESIVGHCVAEILGQGGARPGGPAHSGGSSLGARTAV